MDVDSALALTSRWPARLARMLLVWWIGGLWTICVVVAPTAFRVIDERHVAGALTGTLFRYAAWAGAAVALVLWLLARLRPQHLRLSGLLLLLTAGPPLAGQLFVTPLMEAARAANNLARFGMFHGIASVLFFTACVSAIFLVWRAKLD
jgi:hypothetical protein